MVAAVLVAGSEKAAAHRLGLSHSTVKHHLANARSKVGATTTAQLVWILAPRLPEPEGLAQTDEELPPTMSRLRSASRHVAAELDPWYGSPGVQSCGFDLGRGSRTGSAIKV